jgi:hypothetical protein
MGDVKPPCALVEFFHLCKRIKHSVTGPSSRHNMRPLTYSSMMTLDFVLVAAAGMVLAFPVVLYLIIRGKQKGPKVGSPGLIGRQVQVKGEAAHPSENLEQQEVTVGKEASRHIYDYFA